MLLSLNWLSNYIDLADKSVEEIEYALTMVGFEVEGIEQKGLQPLDKVVVGEVLSREKHPDADRLGVCSVDVGAEEPLQIVCGATNYVVGDRIPVATVGAKLPGDFKIKKSKLRGVKSFGMMCSARELGLGEDHAGLMILTDRPEVGTPINEVFTDTDVVYDIEVTPNRPDSLCHLGIARELSAYFKKELKYPMFSPAYENAEATADGKSGLISAVEVSAPEICPNYYAWSIKDVKVGPSPEWLRKALEAVGQRPINNVVDVTNYVLMELGQPLHAFDAGKIRGGKILVRNATKGEKIVTLDEKERSLSERMLVIADTERPLVVAGVMGSVDAEVDDNTVDVVLESAYFNPSNIRKTSKQLGLSSDSSYRFERGVDPQGAQFAGKRAVDLILEVAGGELISAPIQAGSEPIIVDEVSLKPQYIRDIAGWDFPDEEIREVFERLECEVTVRDEGWTVKVPSWRADLYRPADLAEEFLRMYGTDRIPETPVRSEGLHDKDAPIYTLNHDYSSYLKGQHFQECVHYSLRSEEEVATWFSRFSQEVLKLENPFTSDQTHLRVSLIPGLLDTLKLNHARKTGLKRVFEVGKTFHEKDGQVYEMSSVAFLIHLPDSVSEWKSREAADFYTAKNILNQLGKTAGIDLEAEGYGHLDWGVSIWQEDHCAHVGSFEQGFEARLGLLNLKLVKEWDLDGIVLAGCLDILPDQVSGERKINQFKPFSLFPPAEKDLALVVDSELLAEKVRLDLEAISKEACGEVCQLEEVKVFDVYEGKGMEENKKSLAFSLQFRAEDRTLKDKELNDIFTRIQNQVKESTSYQIRS